MLNTAKKKLISALLACIIVFCAVAHGDEQAPGGPIQPLALNHAGVYALRDAEPALTGTGVKIAVICRSITYIDDKPQNDYRPNVAHRCFNSAQLTFHDLPGLAPGISPHATATCSILFGRDLDAFEPGLGGFRYQGIVPDADADVYEFWHFIINNVFSQSPPDADVVSAGIGNEFDTWWTRGIEALAEQHGLIFVAAIGNGHGSCDPPLYPAAGANVIGVGVVDSVSSHDLAASLANFALARPEHSSLGPTGIGRSKPDIVAPGNCLVADPNDPNRYEPAGNWSSFATPVVAGTIGLLVQKAKQEPELTAAAPSLGANCVLKAIIMNSATKLPYWHRGRLETGDDHRAPLDYIQGAGMINAAAAYDQLTAGRATPGIVPGTGWDKNTLQAGVNPQSVYRITLPEPGAKHITATAVWNRHYNSTYPFAPVPEKDSNLRLELWAVDPNDPDNDYLLDYSDSAVDNVEHIYCRTDANYTTYEIVLSINDLDSSATDAPQQYGLAWTAADSPPADSFFSYDLNADGIIDTADFAILVENCFRSREATAEYLIGDIDANGAIDADDVEILFERTGQKAGWYAPGRSEAE